eukprot:TRINITY_DN1319_c0_g3_i2.p1 TRINITY_DN1319_c0_g3~~TRINITY_DN1319_c0_g3_i2.p1  ORF type:complete len:288 (+),score=60.03 TRINITY_DN1319_c0_g3_i2:88-864(+)
MLKEHKQRKVRMLRKVERGTHIVPYSLGERNNEEVMEGEFDVDLSRLTLIPDTPTLRHQGLPMTPPKVAAEPRRNYLALLSEAELHECNGEICRLMRKFYDSPKDAKWEIAEVLKEVRNLNDKEMANIAFLSVYRNIKAYVMAKRLVLHQKLAKLELIENGEKSDVSYNLSDKSQSSDMKGCVNLVPISENTEQYIEFFFSLCEEYKDICEITSTGIEEICELILAKCNLSTILGKCSVHKTVFYDCVIKDDKISVTS